MPHSFIHIDGAQGEGGGQILRSALSLSLCTGQPFVIENIRARRQRPGLMRQHLTAVLAAAQVCRARVEGAEVGSSTLRFVPGPVRAGDYHFAIGTAGSTGLVLQTVLLPLALAAGPSTVVLEGGTHNPYAPPFHFLEQSFFPLLRRMGVGIEADLERWGFYPAGGGRMVVRIAPVPHLAPLELERRGEVVERHAEAVLAALPAHIGQRELGVVQGRLNWPPEALHLVVLRHGPGNVLLLTVRCERVTAVFTGFGEKGVTAEVVAERAVQPCRRYLASSAAVEEHLADQLLLPLALAGGSYTATELSSHWQTNREVIGRFLPVQINHAALDQAVQRVRVVP